MNTPEMQSPTLAKMLAIEAVRDAINFVSVQPTERIDTDLLLDALIACYKSVGLEMEEAQVLYRESIVRYSDRWTQIAREQVSG